MTPDDLERGMAQGMTAPAPDVLLHALTHIAQEDYPRYPHLIYQVARVRVSAGQYLDAHLLLNSALTGFAEQGDMFGQTECYLLYAWLARHENNDRYLREYLERIAEMQPSPAHLAEWHSLWGEYYLSNEPQRALASFQEAAQRYKHLTSEDPAYWVNVMQVSQRLAETAFQRRLYTLAQDYQNQALEIARGQAGEAMLHWILLQGAQGYYQMGEYERAWEQLAESDKLPARDDEAAQQAAWLKALIAWLTFRDTEARAAIDLMLSGTLRSPRYKCQALIVLGFLFLEHAYNGLEPALHTRRALDSALEARIFAAHNPYLLHSCALLETSIEAARGVINPATLNTLGDAMAFFSTHQLLTDLAKAQLVYAWACAISGRDALSALEACIGTVRELGQVGALARLSIMSRMALMGHWVHVPQGRETLHALDSFREQHAQGSHSLRTRVKALGVPGVWRGATPLDGNTRVLMVLYMLENNGMAHLNDILFALWPDKDYEKASSSFRTLKGRVTHDFMPLLIHDGNSVYKLVPGFPDDWDAREFRASLRRARQHATPALKLGEYARAFGIYAPFAAGMRGDWVDGCRTLYDALFHQTVEEALKVARAAGRDDLAYDWETLAARYAGG